MNGYNRNVFVNCPLDEDYLPLLHPLVFTIITIGFTPRVAVEKLDSGQPRIMKICRLIGQCRFGIHDLSRIRASKRGEIFRLNMPFELGLDIGARVYNPRKHRSKRSLILEKEKYRFQAAISDLSNSDIKHHDGDPATIVRAVRNWFAENGVKGIPSASSIWYSFNDFMTDFYEKRTSEGFTDDDIYEMPLRELLDFMKSWKKRRTRRS
jgi:hypothetical protein